jgi:PKD repeat protein
MRKLVLAVVTFGALALPASAGAVAANFVAAPNPGTTLVPVHFDGSISSPLTFQIGCPSHIESYTWNFGDGTGASGKVVDHTYATAGTYQASLTVASGAEWCSDDTETQTITILR